MATPNVEDDVVANTMGEEQGTGSPSLVLVIHMYAEMGGSFRQWEMGARLRQSGGYGENMVPTCVRRNSYLLKIVCM